MNMKAFLTVITGTAILGASQLETPALEPEGLPDIEKQLKAAQRQVELARHRAAAQAEAQLAQARRKAAGPDEDREELRKEIDVVFGSPLRSIAQPLVIGSIATDAGVVSRLQEDLIVMSRILNKSIERSGEGEKQDLVSGIFISVFPGSRLPQSLYLEGYGALFLLSVKFPLVPPSAAEEVKAEKPADTTWEKTRRELFGPRNVIPGDWLFRHQTERKPVGFDANRVEKLKRDLLEALENAANLRDLKSDEYVVVAVSGTSAGSASGVKRVIGRGLRGTGSTSASVRVETATGKTLDDELPRDTAMIIRVRKSDVDAFAKGNLDFDAFREKATITTY
jgi:hypothetical protein